MKYTVLLVQDPAGGYVVRVPALRGCVTEGDDLPEAIANAQEAITLYLESLAQDGFAAPEDQRVIRLEEDEEEARIVRIAVRDVPLSAG
jgi:antitoxin HicB